jgi:hypothetical protein
MLRNPRRRLKIQPRREKRRLQLIRNLQRRRNKYRTLLMKLLKRMMVRL